MSKNNQNESKKKPTFLTVVEVPQHRASIYVTDEQIIVQDFDDKSNGLVISWKKFKEYGLLAKDGEADVASKTTDNSELGTADKE